MPVTTTVIGGSTSAKQNIDEVTDLTRSAPASISAGLFRALNIHGVGSLSFPRSGRASYLEDRARKRLRVDKVDAAFAHCDEAVKIDPRNAWSVYGHSVVDSRSAKTRAAEADRKPATSISRAIAEWVIEDDRAEPSPATTASS